MQQPGWDQVDALGTASPSLLNKTALPRYTVYYCDNDKDDRHTFLVDNVHKWRSSIVTRTAQTTTHRRQSPRLVTRTEMQRFTPAPALLCCRAADVVSIVQDQPLFICLPRATNNRQQTIRFREYHGIRHHFHATNPKGCLLSQIYYGIVASRVSSTNMF